METETRFRQSKSMSSGPSPQEQPTTKKVQDLPRKPKTVLSNSPTAVFSRPETEAITPTLFNRIAPPKLDFGGIGRKVGLRWRESVIEQQEMSLKEREESLEKREMAIEKRELKVKLREIEVWQKESEWAAKGGRSL